MTEFLVAGGIMGAMGVSLAAVLAFADKKLFVYEDPRIDEVESLLPKANCGACGCAGCRAFAEKAVNGQIAPGKCTVNSPEGVQAIANLLQIDAGREEKRVARLACAGSPNVSSNRAKYIGISTCRGAALVNGGAKGCSWGCLGLADCERVCSFKAIHINRDGLPVVNEALCTACGDCVAICPKQLFSIHPISHRLWVACKNHLEGTQAEDDCEVACTACGRCSADAPAGLIQIQNNLAVINYTANSLATSTPTLRCPTGAIVWLDKDKGPQRGPEAKRITRKSPLPINTADLPLQSSTSSSKEMYS